MARWRRNLGPSMCNICKKEVEDTIHVLGDYDKAQTIWLNLIKPQVKGNLFTSNLNQWLEDNFKLNFGTNQAYSWSTI